MLTRIKNLCKSKNITIAELERELGISNGLISRWSKSSPSIETVAKIADYFGVSIDWIYGKIPSENILDMMKTLPESIIFGLTPEEYIELRKYVDFIKYKRSL